MGVWEGFRMESDKYVYFYEKPMDSTAQAIWEIIDKKSKKLLPFSIIDDLSWIDFSSYSGFESSFIFRYNLDELSEQEKQSKKLVELARDVLKDFVLGEHYNEHELDVYTKDIISNALDKNGGFEVHDDKEPSLYEEFIKEVDNMTTEEEEDIKSTKEARDNRQNREHMMTRKPLSFKVNKGFGDKLD